ncbi:MULTISPECIES: hypothetical protein [Myroides]|uniref:Uncharacterized protein n=1 Tax=Myroides profundi TaxID=480520 RepID=A0AAJ5BCM9_MYRPR|nr:MULTISPECIES: hypothetical protein [Myroides]AJH16768.1 hypothetical protein MPR_3663 [Myroides profundi]MDM1517206.1 hypothetical protein [Myroides odoratimimus]MDM1536339.1 hypothetical protein [Myroides odoratimimus]MDM1675911.1 hypothetical protein [Myroides odoratimimus]SEQ08077.1 hypothetical protein SAMN04488089_101491 [Myroides profundi]
MKKDIYLGEIKEGATPTVIYSNNEVNIIDRSGKFEEMTALVKKLRASGELDIFEERERKRKEEYEKAQKES